MHVVANGEQDVHVEIDTCHVRLVGVTRSATCQPFPCRVAFSKTWFLKPRTVL